LVRRQRRHRLPPSLQDPHGIVRRHQHDPARQPQSHDRRSDRGDRQLRPGRAGDRSMTEVASLESLVRSLVESGAAPATIPAWVHQLAAILIFAGLIVFGFVLPIAGITTWVERRVMGRMQSRIGPNRVGPLGFLQWLADGVKNMLKEDIIPTASDGPLFRFAPYVVMTGVVGTFAAPPFPRALHHRDP